MTGFLPVGAAYPGAPPFGTDPPGTVRIGATPQHHGSCAMAVWAPFSRTVDVRIEPDPGADPATTPRRELPLSSVGHGYFAAVVEDAPAGTRYRLVLDDRVARPDPASRHQPGGVHGPSEVVDLAFDWTDARFVPTPLERMVISELHVGTFTASGTLTDAAARLHELADVGISAVELMPVHQFPGRWNWGYDGVLPFAVQDSYGGPRALQVFVDEAHRLGMAVILDVVYNHLGPEGNVLGAFGPYLTDTYRTPWGPAVNVDGPGSDEVRRYLVDNALSWLRDFHVDALRLDAVHGIVDGTAHTFLADLSEAVDELAVASGRHLWLIAESADNDPRLLAPRSAGGAGLDAQWNDDFHHAVHAVLTGEREGYYRDFGRLDQVATTVTDGFWFRGQYSTHRHRRHGTAELAVDTRHLVVFVQNHDHIGNRPAGDRLATLVSPGALRLAAALLLLVPGIPLLFMGEEYGERAPFPYFVDHGDPDLLAAVRDGRAAEMADLGIAGDPLDPTDPATRDLAVPDRSARDTEEGGRLLALHRDLLRFRAHHPLFAGARRTDDATHVQGEVLLVTRSFGVERAVVLANTSAEDHPSVLPEPPAPADGTWELLLGSDEPELGGDGSATPLPGAGGRVVLGPYAFAVYEWVAAGPSVDR